MKVAFQHAMHNAHWYLHQTLLLWLSGICLLGLVIHLLLIVQVAEAIQCRGMHNRLADSIQVMANLTRPVCMTLQWCQHLCLENSLCW